MSGSSGSDRLFDRHHRTRRRDHLDDALCRPRHEGFEGLDARVEPPRLELLQRVVGDALRARTPRDVRLARHHRHVFLQPRAVGHLPELLLALAFGRDGVARKTANGARLGARPGSGSKDQGNDGNENSQRARHWQLVPRTVGCGERDYCIRSNLLSWRRTPRRTFLAHAAAVAPAALLPRAIFALQATTASAGSVDSRRRHRQTHRRADGLLPATSTSRSSAPSATDAPIAPQRSPRPSPPAVPPAAAASWCPTAASLLARSGSSQASTFTSRRRRRSRSAATRGSTPTVYTRWEGTELMNHSAFIYAFEAENIAVTGTGTLDGQADANTWWSWRAPGPQPSTRPGACAGPAAGARQSRRPCRRAGLRRGPLPAAELRPAVSLAQHPDRGRHHHQLADVGDLNPVLCENVTIRNVSVRSHGPNNDGCDPESLPRRADRGLHVRHRRRLHRAQVGPQRRRPAGEPADRERRDSRLHDEGRPRRRRHRQRDLGRRAQHLCRALPYGQPAARPRAAHQNELSARRDRRRYLYARCDRRAGRGSRGDDRLLLRRGRHGKVSRRPSATSRCARSRAARASMRSSSAATPTIRLRMCASSTARSTASTSRMSSRRSRG